MEVWPKIPDASTPFNLTPAFPGPLERALVIVPTYNERENIANPRWVRMETTRDEDYGMTRLALVSRGVPLVIGAFLAPRQREQVAHGLADALATAKR